MQTRNDRLTLNMLAQTLRTINFYVQLARFMNLKTDYDLSTEIHSESCLAQSNL